MTADEYLADAQRLLGMAGKDITERMDDKEVMADTTSFYLDVERLLTRLTCPFSACREISHSPRLI